MWGRVCAQAAPTSAVTRPLTESLTMQRSPSSLARPTAVIAWAMACLALTGVAHAAPSQGDASRGQTLYSQQCMACHAADISLAGPLHRGVVGRKSASVPDYPYSPALQKLRVTWNDRTLNTWLQSPNAMAPGNRMGFAVPNAQDRQDLIAYLKTLQPQAATAHGKP